MLEEHEEDTQAPCRDGSWSGLPSAEPQSRATLTQLLMKGLSIFCAGNGTCVLYTYGLRSFVPHGIVRFNFFPLNNRTGPEVNFPAPQLIYI